MTLFSRMALRNLLKNKRRSFSTGAAILAGFAGLCLLGGYILRVEKYLAVTSVYINHAGHISIYKKDALENYVNNPRDYHLSGDDLKKIEQIISDKQNIEFTVPVLHGMGLLSNGIKSVPFVGYGIDPKDERRIIEHPQVKKWTHELAPGPQGLSIKDAEGELADTISITKQLSALIGRSLPLSQLSSELKDVQLACRNFFGELGAVNAQLGFEHSTGYAMMEDTGLVAPLKLFQELYGTEGATYLAVYLSEGSTVSSQLQEIQDKLKKAGDQYEAFPFNDDRISLFYVGTMGFLYIMAGFFVFLIFSAVALSITNSMTISLVERVREVGTLRALGYNEKQTTQLLTLESIWLTSFSLGLGYLLAQAVAKIVNAFNIRFYPPGINGDMQFVLTPDTWFCVTLALPIFLICVTCSYIVSKKLVKKNIVDLLQQAN